MDATQVLGLNPKRKSAPTTVLAENALMSPRALLACARQPDDLLTIAFAGIIGQAWLKGRRPLIRGLSDARFRQLITQYFSMPDLRNDTPTAIQTAVDEFDDLVELLLQSRAEASEPLAWLSFAIASAAMGEKHLWQDMGLSGRNVLSEIMSRFFPVLAAKNSGDMKWKKFFYRALCERAEIPICKSPHCAGCCDYAICFGAEE
jgi:nitrogen fixation protein NifQ